MSNTTYVPGAVFGRKLAGGSTARVFTAPGKYVQGPGALAEIGRYFSILKLTRVAILASARGHGAQAGQVAESLTQASTSCVAATFHGECSLDEINSHTQALAAEQVDAVIAVGGGKCVDAGKCIAHRLGVPVVVVPTLASNDAPCSAVSVIYTNEGVDAGGEFFPSNPVMVVVDTQVVADADERYLVAGIGDAMATWYEAQVCYDNPNGLTILGGRPTLAACAMGEVCASTLYADGEGAARAVRGGQLSDELERVVEANTLLSGVGFESGGLAAAHGVAQGYTRVPRVQQNYLHGEMVALGVLSQLMMLNNEAEARRAGEFFARVGLPVHLGQIGLQASDLGKLNDAVEGALAFAPIHNMPLEVSPGAIRDAIIAADKVGSEVARRVGDEAYRRLQRI